MNSNHEKAKRIFESLRKRLHEDPTPEPNSSKHLEIVKSAVREGYQKVGTVSIRQERKKPRRETPNPALISEFDKMMLLNQTTINRILHDTDIRDFLLLVKAVSEPLKRFLLSNVSAKMLAYVQEELPFNEHVPARYEEAACLRILDTIFKLETEGKIDTRSVLNSAFKLSRKFTQSRRLLKTNLTVKANNRQNLSGEKSKSSNRKLKHRTASPSGSLVKKGKKSTSS